MFELVKTHRAAVICSIIARIVCVYFLDPILAFLGRSVLWLAAQLGTSYTDRIFSQAAHLDTYDYAFALTLVYLMLPTIAFAGWMAYFGVRLLLRRRPATSASSVSASNGNGRTDPASSNQPSRTRLDFLREKLAGAAFVILGAVAFFWFCLVTGSQVAQLSLITSFQQHVRIVAPFIDDDAEERLISDWSRMQSKAEYDAIQRRLRAIAEVNGIQLPPNRLYSPFSI
jgi:hypothetical protein